MQAPWASGTLEKPRMSEHDQTLRGRMPAPVMAETPRRPCLTVLRGGPVGLVYTLLPGTETLIGRGGDSDIPFDEQRVSRRHALIKVDATARAVIEDLGSSNGTFVNGSRIKKPHELKDRDRIQIGYACVIQFSYQDELEYQLQHEIAGGIKDPLTKIYTSKYFQDRLETEFTYARRRNTQLGVLIFAIDHFKELSLAHGPAVGDQMLVRVAERVQPILRAGDVFARYDAERFVVLARDLEEEGSLVLAQRIRKVVQESPFDCDGASLRLTVSLGIATLADKPAKSSNLVELAERCLRLTAEASGQSGIGSAAVVAHRDNDDEAPTVLYAPRKKP